MSKASEIERLRRELEAAERELRHAVRDATDAETDRDLWKALAQARAGERWADLAATASGAASDHETLDRACKTVEAAKATLVARGIDPDEKTEKR